MPPTSTVLEGEERTIAPAAGSINLADELKPVLSITDETINSINASIEICARLLDVIQPNLPGKIVISWWKTSVQDQVNPRPSKLKKGQNNKKYLERVPIGNMTKCANRKGPFESSYDDTLAVLIIARKLILHREDMIKSVRLFKGGLIKMQKNRQNHVDNIFLELKDHFHHFQ